MSQRTTSIIVGLATFVASILLAGCGTPAGSAAEPLGQLATERPASPPPKRETPAARGVEFSWPDGEQPAVSRAMTGLDEAYINPGAVIEHGGTLHMYANVFTSWPGRVRVMHLSSTDGADWTLAQDEPVLDSEDVALARPGLDVSTGVVLPDGTWALVFETVSISDPWQIGMATGPGPDGPWTVDAEPILTAGEGGSWDAGGLAWPSVVATDGGFTMYYSTYATNRRQTVIARATSTDGLTWRKDADPVLQAEAAWEGTGLDRPRVVRLGDRFVMVYAGSDLTDRGVAFSSDGITWVRDGDDPAITAEGFPIDGRAWDAALVHRDGNLTYYLEIGTATQAIGTEVYRSTAPIP